MFFAEKKNGMLLIILLMFIFGGENWEAFPLALGFEIITFFFVKLGLIDLIFV